MVTCTCMRWRVILLLHLHSKPKAAYKLEYKPARWCFSMKDAHQWQAWWPNSIPGTYVNKDWENWLVQVVLTSTPYAIVCTWPYSHTIQRLEILDSHQEQKAAWRCYFPCQVKELTAWSSYGGRSMSHLWPRLPLCVLESQGIRVVFSPGTRGPSLQWRLYDLS